MAASPRRGGTFFKVATSEKPARIAVFGDSIAAGMGARGRAFPILIAERLGVDLRDLSGTSSQIGESAGRADAARDCDLIVIAHNATEALLRPPASSLRWLPGRWRKPGWIDPRPYFSSRRRVRLVQRLESGIRWRVKVLWMRLFGAVPNTGPDDYAASLSDLVENLGAERVVVIGALPVDTRFFPGSDVQVREYSSIARTVADRTGATFVEIWDAPRPWSDFCADHFHPNQEGHRRIADLLAPVLAGRLAAVSG